jgi:hypothetical protein
MTFSCADLSIFVPEKIRGAVFVERPERNGRLENKKTFNSANREMKALNESSQKQFGRLASSFSLRRSWPNFFDRRARSDRYPDLGFKPHSAFPLPVALEFVAVTVAQPFRIFTGFPASNRVVSKNPSFLRRIKKFPRTILLHFQTRSALVNYRTGFILALLL